MRKILTTIMGFMGIACAVYYASKYYIETHLSIDHNQLVGFTIVVVIILSSLILGMIANFKLNALQKQNKELLNEVSRLSKTIQNNHYSELSAIENNMECILDLDKGDE